MKNVATVHQHYLLNTYPFRGKTFIKGEGMYLYDEDNHKYLDLMSNYGVSIFGYNHPKISSGLINQIKTLPSLHCSFANDVRAEAALQLVKQCGGKLKKVYFANSGAEAVEAAIKFALLASEKKEIISMDGAYHGKTYASLSVTSNPKYRQFATGLLPNVRFITYGDFDSLKKAINKDTAAVIMEPVQGESGIFSPQSKYLSSVQGLCEENNTFLIFDEIQTGGGRTGKFLSSQHSGVEPDIVCLGKGIAGGIPVGITLVSDKVAVKIPKLAQTSTFGGNPLACRGILEVLYLLDDKMLKYISETGKYFINELENVKNENIKEVRGIGLMIGVEVRKNRNEILKSLQDNNILAGPAGENVVRFLPPYIIAKKQIDEVIKALKEIL
jgi:acetylornithine/LysW-gamma-L-lysine aminotransferase